MSEQRFDRLEKMLEQLIVMVGNNNAATEEVRQRMDALETKMDAGFIKLDAKVEQYGQIQQEDVKGLLESIDKKTDNLEDKFDALNERLFSQETQLQRLKKLAK